MRKSWPLRLSIKLSVFLTLTACASGEAEPKKGSVVIPDMSVIPDVDLPDEGMEDLDMTADLVDMVEDAEIDLPPDVGPDLPEEMGGCMPECGDAEVCENDICVDVCMMAGVECGQATYAGKTAECGSCAGNGVCEAGMCVDPCAEVGATCGDVAYAGVFVSCGSCQTGECVSNTCISGGNAYDVAAGYRHTCARTTSNGLSCWGRNEAGELGLGTTTASYLTPTSVSLIGVRGVASRSQNTCVLGSTDVRCWGPNALGQIGDNTQVDRRSPTIVSTLSTMVQVASGGAHSCAVMPDRTLRCWGANGQGQLGIGNFDAFRLTPVTVPGFTDVVEVQTGLTHTCALKVDGTVWCWGFNDRGQISGTQTASNRPQRIFDIPAAHAIGVGNYHSCAVTTDRELWCWGDGQSGQIGNGQARIERTPVKVNLPNVVAFAGGALHSCAINQNRALYCWGANPEGQIGDGSVMTKFQPVVVSTIANVASVSAGFDHTCAVTRTGLVYCWGMNDFGQVGNNTTTRRLLPTQVF